MIENMRIGFDGKRAMQNFTGLGNYSRYVMSMLCRLAPENDYVLYAPRNRASRVFDDFMQRCPRLKIICPEKGIGKRFPAAWRTYGITSRMQADGIDIYHGLSNELPLNIRQAKNVKSVVTVHDLIFLRYPAYYPWIDRKIYAYKFRKACEHADMVIAISECTRRDIISYFHVPETKIRVIYQGCDASFAQTVSPEKKQEVRQKYDLPAHYILNVGSIEERKNVLLAVKALPHLPPHIHLVILGRRTSYADRVEAFIRSHRLDERVTIRSGVPFADLPAIYRQAEAFVYPSRFEGFGIPIVEALRSEIPVVAATGSCLEEAGGPDSMYVAPDDAEGMAKALNRIINDADLRRRMTSNGKTYACRFSEEGQAQQLLAVYHTLRKA